ncbi:hypothetical protein MW290_19920 [Aquincola tertiaricarbonis]|uniref:Uncharacterized protein n=1 Tax=Aquincola tertiaricarbonis TaxID=391953 RepID=A0ABY4SD21_AQUTE|nr:hypothetical protein [Aquincola tertiaricarbonis]URI11228.1 hypothetical protein MW290_19920 [Aquincola tertiaricarbonis]
MSWLALLHSPETPGADSPAPLHPAGSSRLERRISVFIAMMAMVAGVAVALH